MKPTLRSKILVCIENRKNGYFLAADIARDIGYPLKYGYFDTCPNIRRALTQLCKEGKLYQWITGNGMSPSSLSNTPKYNVNYLSVDSDLAKTLLNHPNRKLIGYRIR